MVLNFPRTKIRFGFRKGIKNISNASQLITVNMFPLNVTLRLFESSQHYFSMAKGKLALKSLTNNLNSGLDNIRLKSEIQKNWLSGNTLKCAEEIQLCEGKLPRRTSADFALENTICFQTSVP